MTTNAVAELTPAGRAILAALEGGPMTRQALSGAPGQPLGSVGTRLAVLSERGLVHLGADLVALPGQRVKGYRSDAEAEHERRRQRQEAGLITLHPDDVGGFAAQALHAFAIELYGRRRGLRPSRREGR